MKIKTISPQDNDYLQIVGTIAKVPEKFYYLGTIPDQRLPSVAIVGSRKPTNYGKEVTYQLAYDLAKRGIIIISGLALGVDAIAHRAALDAGGKTIAILANGLDQIRPATNRGLAEEILKSGGAILSEYEPGIGVRDFQLLARNRLVSGLADALVVTEAAKRSGTISTVNHALDQNREVFVVPGNITSPMSAGCNALLRQGAQPATCVEDILEVITPGLIEEQTLLPLGSTPAETKIIELMQSGVRSGEELQAKSGLETTELSQTITMMELNGLIRALGANQWTLR